MDLGLAVTTVRAIGEIRLARLNASDRLQAALEVYRHEFIR